MIPVSNGSRLAEALPDARLQILEGAGHLYPTDAPEADREVLDFLAGSSSWPGVSRRRRADACRRASRDRAVAFLDLLM